MMTSRWASIVARDGVSLTTVVGGIPLALRHARMVHRAGWQGIRFSIADEGERARVAAIFHQVPGPEGLLIEFSTSEKDSKRYHITSLDASALYTQHLLTTSSGPLPTEIAPSFSISSRADIDLATKFLYEEIRKPVDMDGVIAYFVMRPLSRIFTRALLDTAITPNQATLGALLCGIAAAIFAAMGGHFHAIMAGVLYWCGGVIDCIDGEMARLRLQSSKLGEWLDSMVDEFSTIILIIGIGIGISRDGQGDYWQFIALVGAGIAIGTLTRMYSHLHRHGLAIDTAFFPWFFCDSPPSTGNRSPSRFGTVITFLGHFVRRDGNLTITSLLLLLNMRKTALCMMLAGYVAATLLLITHYWIMSLRKR